MKILISLLLLTGIYINSFADSPLTSTRFWEIYNHPTLNMFEKMQGKINEEGCNFLLNKKTPLEIRIAAVNSLGWNIKGQHNAETYLAYIISKHKYENKNMFLQHGQKEDLIIYAYMLAMDNYFDVNRSIDICKNPVITNDKSRCIQLISALIKSQSFIYKDYCEVYKCLHVVREDKSLINDIQETAIQEIFNYINGYKNNCSYLYK